MNTKNILLTGGRAPATLHLARMLNEVGHEVYVAESEKFHLSKKSNAIKCSYVVPKPNENQNEYIRTLIRICKLNQIDLIIPTCEELFHIAKFKCLFNENDISVFCDDIDTLRLLHNKSTFMSYLKENNYLYPKTYKVTSIDELEYCLVNLPNQKVVLKAAYSRFASEVYILNSSEDMPHIYVTNENPWIVQEYISGTQYCSYSIAVGGKVVAHTCYPTLYTAGIGANVYFKHIEEPMIQQFVDKLVRELNFTGQIAFDFIKDDRSGNFYPIECNPRATSGLHLFDDIKEFQNLFIHSNHQMVRPSRNKSYKLGIPMLMYGLSEGYLVKKPLNFFQDFLNSTDVIYSAMDKSPFLYQGIIFLVMMVRKIKSRKKLTEMTTEDIEWSGD